jgi:hypothetical protein
MNKMRSLSAIWLVRGRISQAVWWGLWLALVIAALSVAQAQRGRDSSQFDSTFSQPGDGRTGGAGDLDSREEERRFRLLNAERQKTMVSDTNKLLKLATQLNAEIAAANQSELTPAQLKSIGEIEKLARKVKEKMSLSVRGTPMSPGTIFREDR